MQPIRHVGIPFEHLTAEMAAVPLASELALRVGVVELDPEMGGKMPELWRGAEGKLIGSFPGFLVDEMVAIRDRIWFQGTQNDAAGLARSRRVVRLHDYVARLAGELLEVNGSTAVPRLLDGDAPDGKLNPAVLAKRRRTWRWLTFALPADLLLAAIDPNKVAPDAVELLSPAIKNMLRDRGYAETHLHVGAGLDFPTLWVSAQHAIALDELTSTAFQSPGAEFDEGKQLGPWLIRALIARHLLGTYLTTNLGVSTFAEYLTTTVRDRVNSLSVAGAFTSIVAALADLRNGRLSDAGPSFVDLQKVYGLLSGVTEAQWSHDFERRDEADTLFHFFPAARSGRPTTEVSFLRAAFAHLKKLADEKKEDKQDSLFTSLFWQTVRVRNLFYRHVTQRPLTPGLLWFIRFYGRISAARKPLDEKFQIQSAAHIGGRGKGLRSLEIRTQPSAVTSDNVRLFETVAELRRDWQKQAQKTGQPLEACELGVVLHFTKDRGGEVAKGVPRAFWRLSNTDPRSTAPHTGNPQGFRYSSFREKKLAEARALSWVLQTYPLSIQYLRGVDICTDEMGVPNWVFVPVLYAVRKAANVASGLLRAQLSHAVPPLRTTIHAGEDFIHLQTGLRCVAEAIDQLGLREGDRIGHGVSLGIDPRAWSQQVGRVAMNLEDRLFDLVWEWSWHGTRRGSKVFARQHVLEHEIAERSEQLFGDTLSPFDLEKLRQDLCEPKLLKLVGFGDAGMMPEFDKEKQPRLWRLQHFLTSRDLFDRGRELVWVDVAREEESLAHLQAELRERVGSLGIVVEVNPTSNLLIGNLDDLTNHPMWRLRPPRPQADDPPPVGVCIGSDDPITFNSNLRQEYQCLADAMTLAGLSDEEASQWLERTRLCGLEHRFTLSDNLELPLDAILNTDLELAPH